MSELKTVQLAIIDYLSKQNSPVSSEKMAVFFGISGKTLRKYISDIALVLNKHGAHIEAKTGSGLMLVQDDAQEFQKFISNSPNEKDNYVIMPANVQRAHCVVRYLLLRSRYISIENLGDVMYINRTSLLQDLEIVKSILKNFNLALEAKSKLGLRITGSEMDIRNCLVYEKNFYNHSTINYAEKEYKKLINVDTEVLNQLKEIIFKSQEIFTKIYLSSHAIESLAYLMVVSSRRGEQGHNLVLNKDLITYFTNRNSYYVARYIASQSEPLLNYQFSTDEVICFTIFILANRIFLGEDNVTNYERFLELKDVAFNLVMYLNNINDFHFMKSDMILVNDICYQLFGMIYRLQYHFVYASEELETNLPVLANKLAMQSAYYLKNVLEVEFNETEIILLGQTIYPAFDRYQLPIKKNKTLILSKDGKREAQRISERIQCYFSRFLSSVDLFDEMDLQYLDYSEYDLIFTDLPNPEKIEHSENQLVIPVSLYFDENDRAKITQQLLYYGTTFFNEFEKLFKKPLLFRNLEVRNKTELFEKMEELLLDKLDLKPGLAKELQRNIELYCPEAKDNYSIFMPLEKYTKTSFVAFFTLKKPIQWKMKKSQVFILVHQGDCKGSDNVFENEFATHNIEQACENSMLIDALLKGEDYQALAKIIIDNSLNNLTK